MLGKLIKHEMKAMARLLLPLFLILAALTVVNRIVIYLDIFKGTLQVIPGLLIFVYVVSIIAVIIVSAVLVIYRFYKNLMTDEGYLMFTLPAKAHDLINSKLISSFLWSLASMLVFILSIFIVASGSFSPAEFKDGLHQFAEEAKNQLGSTTSLFFIELGIMIILGILNNILTVYISIAIGQLFNGHKILGSVVAYIGISIVLQIVTSVGTGILGIMLGNSINDIASLAKILFPLILVFLLILNVIYYLGTNLIFNKKLNLE